jgi:multidrug efflux pump subunit AcrA (membrane-fusion protein)
VRWAEFAEESRRLAEIRESEAARQAQAEQQAAGARAGVEQLSRRLAAQREHLIDVARRLNEPQPALDGVARTGLIDPGEAIRRAREAVDQADVEARRAEERGMRPALFPTMSTNGRNALIYSASAFGMWLFSCGLLVLSPQSGSASISLLLWSGCGLPAIAFFAGYLVISIVGRPRVQPLNQVHHSARLGGVICFGGTYLGWILFLAVSALL